MANGQRNLGRGLGDLIEEVSAVKAIQTPPAPAADVQPRPPAVVQEEAPAPAPVASPKPKTARWPFAVLAVVILCWIVTYAIQSVRQKELAQAASFSEQRVLDLEAQLTQQARAATIEEAPPVAPVAVAVETDPEDGSLAWASLIKVTGVKTEQREGFVRFVLETAAFAYRTEMAADAEEPLKQLASAIVPHAGACEVVVVGHTDSDPVRAGGPYHDNLDLALRRATVATDFLRRVGGLPADSLQARAADEAGAPYPNDTPANKVLNRTVTIEIHPKR